MLTAGRPFRGRELDELKEFLAGAGLRYEEGIEYSVCLKEGGVITGTGSVEANVIKCVAVEKSRQGQGIMAQIISELIQYLYEKETISGEEFMRILNAQPQLPAGTSADSTNAVQ